ncbi:MAG TPA: calcium-binding protein, partial [Nitrospira sp.]|nr:calcium-binding protein [Nitrospira sp.]
ILSGGAGNDSLDGGTGADRMTGGSGNDLFVVDNINDIIVESAGQGMDTVQTSLSYALGANLENLTLTGNAAINATGNSLNNILTGNGAVNVLTGGAGNDTYVVGLGDTIVEAASAGTDTVKSDLSWTLGTNLENLTLTGVAAVNGTGNSLANTLTGNSAANVLSGAAGADTLIGAQGDDLYIVDNVGDKVTELVGEGIDTVQSSVSYTLTANVENLTLTGTSAINGTGNGLDNVLAGNSASNRLTGGTGNDTYVIGAGDTVVEAVNAGIDTVQSSITHTLAANVENLSLIGTAAINGTGNTLNNILVGNSAANTLTGGVGDDMYVVGAGDTVVEAVNAGTDTVQSTVTWTLGVNLENLTLAGTAAINGTGNTLANAIIGNANDNVLTGGDGNDTLSGGKGNDVFNGGTGNDVFQLARGDGQDTITDASGTSDRLSFASGINPLDLMLSQSANDLRIAVYGSTDQVTINNWYAGATNQIETVQAGNGQQLMSTQVNQLIQAMAGFTQQTGLSWDQAIAQRPQDVQQILAANW